MSDESPSICIKFFAIPLDKGTNIRYICIYFLHLKLVSHEQKSITH